MNSLEDNLDPIEEEHAQQQPLSVGIKKEEILPNNCNQKEEEEEEEVEVGVSEINNDAIHATLTAASAEAAEASGSGGVGTNGPQHRWSNNRRSQILKQQSIHQGEFNKVVFSDSRRRPLSCTPPSTSLSTSVSIDDEDLTASMASNPQSANGGGGNGHTADLAVLNDIKIEVDDDVNQLHHPQIDEPETESRPQTEAEIGDEQLEDHQDDDHGGGGGGASRRRPQLRLSRSLSSPDFMKSYKASFDAERDWPHVDDAEDDEVDGGEQLLSEVLNNHQPREFREVQRELREESLRRGSSADRLNQLRKRKRFDTDRI